MKLEISKLAVWIEKSWLETDFRNRLEKLKADPKPSLSIIQRDNQLTSQLIDCLVFEPFIGSHTTRFKKSPDILGFLHWTAAFLQKANSIANFPDYVSALEFYVPPCSKASCLIKFGLGASDFDSAKIVKDTCQALHFNFNSVSPLYPVLVSGSMMKCELLGALLKHANPKLENASECFKCEEDDEDGVYVWPEPIRIQGVNLMLLKLRSPTKSTEDYMNMRNKVRNILVMMSSVCCLIEDRAFIIDSIGQFMQGYTQILQRQERHELEISKLVVYIESTWKKGDYGRKLDEISNHNPLVQFLERQMGSFDCSLLVTLLADPNTHEPFIQSHSHMKQPYINAFLDWTAAYVEMANLNITFDAFVSRIPSTQDPQAEIKIKAELERAKMVDAVHLHSKCLPFMEEKNEAGRVQLRRNPKLFEELEREYLDTPLVVMIFLGKPGLGKSTLLNYITQFCNETPQLPSKFVVGNTTGHTTRGSWVLSHPLFYQEHQIMLLDVEGLGGTEMIDSLQQVQQKNLVSAILTVASVPCILITNEKTCMDFVRELVKDMAYLQEKFGFQLERIFLLFHDKVDATEAKNPEFASFINSLNGSHFSSREVIKLLNKPDFKSADAHIPRTTFLKKLLDDSLFPKKHSDGEKVTRSNLLSMFKIISSHTTLNLDDLLLTEDEKKKKQSIIERNVREIRNLQESITSDDNVNLLSYFNTKFRSFLTFTEEEQKTTSSNLREHCSQRIDFELLTVRGKLKEIQSYHHDTIHSTSPEEMKEKTENLVKNYYESSWSVFDFRRKVKELKDKLKLTWVHFPKSRETIDSLLATVESSESYYTKWSIGVFAGQFLLTVATAGVGGALGAASVAAKAGVTIGRAVATVAAEVVIGAGTGAAMTGGGSIGYNIFEAKKNQVKAVELIKVNSWFRKGTINEDAFKEIKDNAEYPHLHPGAHGPVLLLLGPKNMKVSEFANTFVRYINPNTPAEFKAFNVDKYTQILSFDYYHGKCGCHTRSHLICLRMKKKEKSKYYNDMKKIAEMLIPVTSLTYVLMDSQANYTEPLLEGLRRPMDAKVVVICKNETDSEAMVALSLKGACEVKRMNEEMRRSQMTQVELDLAVAEIKQEFDKSTVRPFSQFKDGLTELSAALRA